MAACLLSFYYAPSFSRISSASLALSVLDIKYYKWKRRNIKKYLIFNVPVHFSFNDKHHDLKCLGWKEFIWLIGYSPSSREARIGTQAANWRHVAYSSFLLAGSASFLCYIAEEAPVFRDDTCPLRTGPSYIN